MHLTETIEVSTFSTWSTESIKENKLQKKKQQQNPRKIEREIKYISLPCRKNTRNMSQIDKNK